MYTFSDLPKYELVDGTYVEVEYRVVELNPEEGVTPSGGTKDEDGNYNLTNTMDTTSVTITKVWNDQDDKYGLRPDSVTVTLTATSNGITYAYSVELTEENGWSQNINVRTHDVAGISLPTRFPKTWRSPIRHRTPRRRPLRLLTLRTRLRSP